MVRATHVLSLSKRLTHGARRAQKAGRDADAYDLRAASSYLREFAQALAGGSAGTPSRDDYRCRTADLGAATADPTSSIWSCQQGRACLPGRCASPFRCACAPRRVL